MGHFGPFWDPSGGLYKEDSQGFRGFWTILGQFDPGRITPGPDLAILAISVGLG